MTDATQSSQTWEREIIENVLLAHVKEQRSQRRWRYFFRFLVLGFILFLVFASFYEGKPRPSLKDHVALIDIDGVIGENHGVTADEVATGLRNAFEADRAKGIIIRINSPGGSPVQSAYIYDEIKRLRALHEDKKVYAVIMDVGASGGYFIAAAADEIYANASSIVGSIGVLMPGLGFVGASEKLGVEQRSLTAGKNKLFLDPLSPLNEKQVQFAETLLSNAHSHFIKAVKEGRGDRLKQNNDIFSGLFWTGDQAMKLGLVDALGSAGFVAREVIGVEEVIDYTISNNLFDKLASRFGAAFNQEIAMKLGLMGPSKLQ